MTTRILYLARYRIPHACVSLQFDHMLEGIDRTVVSSPVPWHEIKNIFEGHGIDCSKFEYLPDNEIVDKYPEIDNWVFPDDYRGWWLRQQALKLSVLDYLRHDVMLMHDPDTFMTEPYRCYDNGVLNYLILPNTTHGSYNGVLESVLKIPRQSPHCFITELVPCLKQDWISLKDTLEQLHNRHFLDAIIDNVPGMPTVPPWGNGNLIKWFSEYEFISNWTLSRHSVNFTEQRRFEYNSLDKIKNFNKQYNAMCDAIPDLSLSMQMDSGRVKDFEYYLSTIKERVL
jgi:hypothetical protein